MAIYVTRFKEVEAYVIRKHNTVAQYIVLRPVLDPCNETIQMPGTWVKKRWRDQEGLDLVGAREAVETSEKEGGQNRHK